MSSPSSSSPTAAVATADKSQSFGQSLQTAGYVLFNKTTVTIVCAGLAIYLFYHLGRSIFAPRSGYDGTSLLAYSRGVDIAALVLFLAWLYSTYVTMNASDQSNLFGWFLRWTHDFWNDPNTFLEITLFTFVFFVVVYLFRVPMAPEIKPVIVHIVETKIWIVFAMFIIIFFFKYVLKIPIIDLIYNNQIVNYFENLPSLQWYAPAPAPGSGPSLAPAPAPRSGPSPAPAPAPGSAPAPAPAPGSAPGSSAPGSAPGSSAPGSAPGSSAPAPACSPAPAPAPKEVFNLSNQVYTYEEAREVCKAFGADLANYDQIEQAYQKDGEWCNYGWSDQQWALMPTQRDTYNNLQNSADKNACGRPGVNGGFIGNSAIRMGANCYGVKPPQPAGFEYAKPIDVFPAAAPAAAMPTAQDLWKATAKLNAFNNLKRDWSQY